MAEKLADLFCDETRWTKGRLAEDINGMSVGPTKPEAVCFCFLGGAHRVARGYAQAPQRLWDFVHKSIAFAGSTANGVAEWNDVFATFDDIKKAAKKFDELIAEYENTIQ